MNIQFARLNGMSGAHMLDLYGRTAVQQAAPSAPQPELQRKPSKRLPLKEATRVLLRQAHSKLPQGSLGSLSGSQPGSPQVAPPGGATAGGAPSGLGSRPGGDGAAAAAASQPPSRTPSSLVPVSRQGTVRFDVPPNGGEPEGGGEPAQHSASAFAAAAATPRVLHIPDEREERLLPYR